MSRAARLTAFPGCASALAFGLAWLAACAGQTDRFYALDVLPHGSGGAPAEFKTHVVLSVSIPSIDDRRELVVHAGEDRILVLEHERWAAPLADLVTQTLGRDIEQRRADVLVADRRFDQSNATPVRVTVDVIRLTVDRSAHATLEAHWRIVDPATGTDLTGGGDFDAPVSGSAVDEYSAAARALSECLSELAGRLVEKLPAR